MKKIITTALLMSMLSMTVMPAVAVSGKIQLHQNNLKA